MADNEQKMCTKGKWGILEYSNLLEKVNKNAFPVNTCSGKYKILTSPRYDLFALTWLFSIESK